MYCCLRPWPTSHLWVSFGHVWRHCCYCHMARQNVERGFSVNKQVEIDNLSEEAFVAKRLICDHVTAVGGLQNIDTSNMQLLLAASSARRMWPTLTMKGIRKIQVEEERSEKLWMMKFTNWKIRKDVCKMMWMVWLHQLMSMLRKQRRHTSLLDS